MSTRMCIVGTIATVPYYSKAPDRVAYCSFRVASNDRVFDQEKQEWVDVSTNWYTVNAFRGLAEHARASFAVGDRIIAYGRVRVNNWETKGKNGTSVELEVEALGHDLRWGITRFTKLVESRAAGDSARSGAPGEGSDPDELTTDEAAVHETHAHGYPVDGAASDGSASDGSAADDSGWASAGNGAEASEQGEFGRIAA